MSEHQQLEYKQTWTFEDRLSIWNHGQLPEGWSVERLTTEHSSEPFNPLLANAFFRAGQIESWGRGIQKIIEACRAGDSEIPTFRFDPTGVTIEFRTRSLKVGEKVGEKVGAHLTENQRKILIILRGDSTASARCIAEQVKIYVRKVEENIRKLREKGVLLRVGAARGGHWEVLDL